MLFEYIPINLEERIFIHKFTKVLYRGYNKIIFEKY